MATHAQSLADSYVNGNRKAVRDVLEIMRPLEACALCLAIAEDLRTTRGREEWRAFIASAMAWGDA